MFRLFIFLDKFQKIEFVKWKLKTLKKNFKGKFNFANTFLFKGRNSIIVGKDFGKGIFLWIKILDFKEGFQGGAF